MTRLLRQGARALAGVLLAGSIAGCGQGQDSYCQSLSANLAIFSDDGTGVALLNHLDELNAIAAKAPDDLTDEWQTVTTALGDLLHAITAAGFKPGDFVDGKPPASATAAQRDSIAAAASQVSQPDVVDAFSGIDQQAKDVCKLQLGI